jgi:enhancer of polycomb-like protein
MPRIHNPTTLRSRNRVTNKTRLRIHRGDIEFDPDDSPIPISNDTAGVDAEDANEHHLQAVLSAASQQHLINNNKKITRGSAAEKVHAPAPAAYIPTPDSTGIVDGYEELYPPGKWTDPATYIRSSETVDDAIDSGLTGTFTYFMDERDQEWLDKNNEEARGEGTSAQGAVSAAGTSTRSGSSLRSAKAKGKEPEVVQPLVISENEFELVMGLFEKVTHEKTEFLHHGFEQGVPFPPFSDYQETLSMPLPPATFATFTVPVWVPTPSQLTRIARIIYPYWRERRTERGGHRIIPTLNFDETDTQNESYICFRRREIKAVRKTRASQVTSSDKLLRLQSELLSSLDLAKNVLNRETLKRDVAYQSQNVWEKRLSLVELKRKFPSLGAKEDEELLHDKERVPKRPRMDPASVCVYSYMLSCGIIDH